MDDVEKARVAELMAAMAGEGGAASAFTLQHEFCGPLRAAVRRAAAARQVELTVAEVDDLVSDVVLMLHGIAAAWKAEGGAMPWVWAEKRVRNILDRHVGIFTDELDEARVAKAEQAMVRRGGEERPGRVAEPASLQVLERMAGGDRRVHTLWRALQRVTTSERDAELWLEMRVQEALGDRSPAATVGPQLGMSPEAARQQRRRTDLRLRSLLETDARYADLAEVAGLVALPSVA